MHRWNNRSAKHALYTTDYPRKSQAFLTGHFFCVGVALNFSSLGRNCVTTFPWLGCFRRLLAYVIHSQNTKNPSCVGARCSFLMVVLCKGTFYRNDWTCQRLVSANNLTWLLACVAFVWKGRERVLGARGALGGREGGGARPSRFSRT